MKILITGPESSGKTTLSIDVANFLKGELIPEYARTYLHENGSKYIKADLLKMATRHYLKLEEIRNKSKANTLILDTYLLNIKIWSEVKFGTCDPWIVSRLKETCFDIVFLLKPNIPWVYDPLRENKKDRMYLFELYKNELEQLKWNYKIIDENLELRTQQTIDFIETFVKLKDVS